MTLFRQCDLFNPGAWALGPGNCETVSWFNFYDSALYGLFGAFWAYMWIRHHTHNVHFTAKHKIVKDFATLICNLLPVAILVNLNIRTVKSHKAPLDLKY